jgi:hypothetical protein
MQTHDDGKKERTGEKNKGQLTVMSDWLCMRDEGVGEARVLSSVVSLSCIVMSTSTIS